MKRLSMEEMRIAGAKITRKETYSHKKVEYEMEFGGVFFSIRATHPGGVSAGKVTYVMVTGSPLRVILPTTIRGAMAAMSHIVEKKIEGLRFKAA